MLALFLSLVTQTPMLTPCRIEGIADPTRCGTLRVPENRAIKHGRTIDLKIVLVLPPDTTRMGQDWHDPIVPVPGGPGGDITNAAAGWARILTDARKTRSVLFVDPRGTGGSGAIDCDLDDAASGRLRGFFRDFLPADKVRACRKDLELRADLTQYTTESIATDLDEVRQALGFKKLILYGVSGGTRESLVYLRRYPDHVRAIILGGVVAQDFRMSADYARDSQGALDELTADCAAEPACSAAYPEFKQNVRRLLDTLTRKPAVLTLTLANGTVDTITITRDIFAEQMRTTLYNPFRAARFPMIVHRALAGDFHPFAETLVPNNRVPPPDGIAMGHFLSVTCSEDLPRIDPNTLPSSGATTFLGEYRVRQQLAGCAFWPRARLPKDHFTPVSSPVPALLIEGSADPVTPPRWGESALRYLPNGRQVVFPHGGHVPINAPCAMRLVAEFLDAGSVANLDFSCAASFQRPPFVIDSGRAPR